MSIFGTDVGYPHTTGISPKGISYKPVKKPRVKTPKVKKQKVPLTKTQLRVRAKAKHVSQRKTKRQVRRIWHKLI